MKIEDQILTTIKSYDISALEYFNNVANLLPKKSLDKFLDLLPKNKARILDLGCGSGRDANYLHKKKTNVIGIDLSNELINLSRKSYPYIDFRVMDIRKLDFEIESFDGIWASASLLHIPKENINDILESINRILKKGGIIFMSFKEGVGQEFVPDHRYGGESKFWSYFTLNEIEHFILKAGFKIVNKEINRPLTNYNERSWIEIFSIKIL